MAAGVPKSIAFCLLVLNLVFYGIVSFIAGWAIDYGIEHSPRTASGSPIWDRLFSIYFPIGNMATGFFVMFSLVAGVVGFATSFAGISNIFHWNVPNLLSAATFSIITWSLTLLAMGLACKEMNIGGRDENLRALETLTIILSITQFFCMAAICAGFPDVFARQRNMGGRV